MAEKPTYEELEQTVKELEKQAADRKRAEEALRESEERYHRLFNKGNDAVLVYQLTSDGTLGRFIEANDNAYQRLGYTREELLGLTPLDIITPKDHDTLPAITEKLFAEKHCLFESVHRAKDGSEIPVNINASLFDFQGQPTVLCIARDITERKRAEEALREAHDELEKRVRERTSELARANEELHVEIIERKRAEQELRESEESWRDSFNSLEDIMLIVNTDYIINKMNARGLRLFGKTEEEVIGEKCHRVIHGMDEPGEFCPFRKTLKTGKPALEVDRYEKAFDKYFNIKSCPIFNDLGEITGFVDLMRDVTERKRAEETLRESEAKSRLILQTMPSGLFTVGLNKRITSWNKGAEEITGLKAGDVIGKDCLEALDCDECKKECALFDDTADKPIHGTECVIHVGDRAIALSKNVDFLIDSEGNVIGGLESFVDITESKQAEDALRASEENYRSLVESTEDSVYLIDSQYRYLFMNEKHLSRFGVSEDKVIGKTYGEFHAEEETETFIEKVNKVMETGKSIWHEYRSQRDGRYFLRTLSPVKGEDGRVISVTVISKDITERKRLETQLQHGQRMEAIGTLAGGIAHDFNNVLMAIRGHTSLVLADTHPDHPHFENLSGIEDMVQRGAELTRQLLGFARGGKYDVKPTDLNEIVEKSCEMFGRTKKEVEVHTRRQKEIRPVEVDQAQIEQVLLNLYVNAWQAMPHGGDLYVETSHVALAEDYARPLGVEPGNYVKISVTDTGVGMDKATQARIFDPFFTTKERGRGTGLGLASAYGVIKNHGGIIDVHSEKGKGATINIYLPASEKQVEVREGKTVDQIVMGAGTVLLVDDENVILGVGKEMLEKIGYQVLLATSGKEAIELYDRHQDEIDLVVLDMIMPHMGGGETYDRMKEKNPRVKVLLSSGYSINGQATEILERGCDGFIQKPFNMAELSVRIREILGRE